MGRKVWLLFLIVWLASVGWSFSQLNLEWWPSSKKEWPNKEDLENVRDNKKDDKKTDYRFPIYPQGELMGENADGSVSFQTVDSPRKVFDWYRQYGVENKFQTRNLNFSQTNDRIQAVITLQKHEVSFLVTIRKGGEGELTIINLLGT